MKAKIKTIEIRRAEGSSIDDPNLGKWQTFHTIKDANRRLRQISGTASKGGGYDKTDVKIQWENGDAYSGRWDVKHYTERDCDTEIGEHIKQFLEYQAGLRAGYDGKINPCSLVDKMEITRMLEEVDLED